MIQVFRCECCGEVYNTGEECLNHEKMHPAALSVYPERYGRMEPFPQTVMVLFDSGARVEYRIKEGQIWK